MSRLALMLGAIALSLSGFFKIQEAVAQPTVDNVVGLSISELRAQIDPIDEANNWDTMVETAPLVAAWWDANSTVELTPDDMWWILEHFHRADDGLDEKNFSAKWTGFIEVPITGEYTFSVSPFKMSQEHAGGTIRESMSLKIADQTILNSTPTEFASEATPVELTGGERIPLEVNFSHFSDQTPGRNSPALAVLRWTGPSIEDSVVPTTALFPPTGEGNGLLAEYQSTSEEVTNTRSRIEPVIDRCWFHEGSVMPKYPNRQAALLEKSWVAVTDANYFTEWSQIPEENDGSHPFYFRKTAGFMSSAQKAAVIQEFMECPEVLQAMNWNQLKGIFHILRPGSPDDALDILGNWAQLKPDAKTLFSSNLTETNRQDFRYLVTSIFWQYEPHFALIQERFLELPDGSCSLPAAYTLAYGYMMQGEIITWIEFLESKLAQETLVGDLRANWLLARAMAEELRRCPAERHIQGRERLDAGRGWLDEARLMAESEPVQLRLLKELLIRQASLGQYETVLTQITDAAESFTSPTAQQALTEWRTTVESLEQAGIDRQQADAEAAQAGYLAELNRRLVKANSTGDTSSAARYSMLIEAVESAAQE